MKFRRLLSAFVWLAFVFGIGQAGSENSLLEQINDDLSNGNIVVVYQMLNDDTTSEQYADWAHYLNEFADSNTPLYKFYSADVALNERLSENSLDITDSYTLFLNKDGPNFFYEGVLVENLVYLAVKSHYAQQAVYQAFIPDRATISLD